MNKGQQANGQVESEIVVDFKSLKVDDELRRLVPAHKKSEIALLERSVLEAKGCRETLPAWEQKPGQYTLLDGHTRRDFCIKHDFQTVRIRLVPLKDKEAAKAYVKQLQLGRRNTPAHAESYLRGSHYNEMKQTHGGDRRSKAQRDPSNEAAESRDQPDLLKDRTADALAKEYEVSPATIKRDAQFARLLDAVLEQAGMADKRWQLLGGDVRLNRGAVRKLSALKGKELKQQIEHMLEHGRLPRKDRAKEGSPKTTVKTQAKTLVEKLKARDTELPVKMLKEMATLLGFTLAKKK